MGHYSLKFYIGLLLLIQPQLGSTTESRSVHEHTQDDIDEECFYWFVKQPPPQISCDPYPYQTLRLSCTLLLKNTNILATNMHWYYRNVQSEYKSVEDQLLTTTRFRPVPLDMHSKSVSLTSRITVTRVAKGDYYCKPEVMGIGFLLPSDPTRIESYGSYQSLNTCDSQYLSDLSVKCAQRVNRFEDREAIRLLVLGISFVRYLTVKVYGFVRGDSPIVPLPGCLYQYMAEPFQQPMCDPYKLMRNELSLMCMVLADGRALKPNRKFNIQWYYNPPRGDRILIHKSTFSFQQSAVSRGILYNIRITNIQEGVYYCQPYLEGVGELLASTPTVVRPPGSYDHLMQCERRFPIQSRSALQCIITLEDAGCTSTVNEFINISRSTFEEAFGQVRMNNISSPTQMTFESSDPPIGDSSSSTPLWVYVLAAIGGVLLVGGTAAVLLATAYCYRRKLKTRSKHGTTDTRQGQNGEAVHVQMRSRGLIPQQQEHEMSHTRGEGVSGPSVLSIAHTVIQELTEAAQCQNKNNREPVYLNCHPHEQSPNQRETAQNGWEGAANGSLVCHTAHTVAQDQPEVAARHSTQSLQEEQPYYSYPRWIAQRQKIQDTDDDGYAYVHNNSSAASSTRSDRTSQEKESQAAAELEPCLYEEPYPSTIAVNSTRSRRPCMSLSARDCHREYKQLRIETKDYISMYDVVRTPERPEIK